MSGNCFLDRYNSSPWKRKRLRPTYTRALFLLGSPSFCLAQFHMETTDPPGASRGFLPAPSNVLVRKRGDGLEKRGSSSPDFLSRAPSCVEGRQLRMLLIDKYLRYVSCICAVCLAVGVFEMFDTDGWEKGACQTRYGYMHVCARARAFELVYGLAPVCESRFGVGPGIHRCHLAHGLAIFDTSLALLALTSIPSTSQPPPLIRQPPASLPPI
jgi:hypothetical protein